MTPSLKRTLTSSRPQLTRVTPLRSYRKALIVLGVGLFVLATLYAHIRIANNEHYVGYLALLDRGFDLAVTSTILIITFCLGRRLSRVLSLNFVSAGEEISFSIMLGTGASGMLIFGFGLAGLLTPIPILVLLLTIVAFTAGETSRLFHCIRVAVATARATRGRTRYIAFVFLLLLSLVVIEALVPPWTPDETIYHLPATKAFVDQGRIYPLYDNSLGNMPFLIQMIYALCLMAKADIAARLFSLALTLTTGLSIYAFCRRFLEGNSGLFALVAFVGGAMVVQVGITARIDVSLAGMLFLTTFALMVYLDNGKRGWLYAAGLLGGFSLGIKLTALAWLGLLGLMFVFERFFRKRESLTAVTRDVVILTSLIVITASPWFIKNFIWFQNPVYPFQTGEVAAFESGTVRYFDENDEHRLDAHFDKVKQRAPDQVAEIEKELAAQAARRKSRNPLRFWDYYTNPSAYFLGDYRHYPNYAFLLVPLYLFLPKQKWLTWLMLLSVGFFIALTSTTWISRFLLPIYPSLAVISGYTLAALTKKLSSRSPLAAGLPVYFLTACVAVSMVVSADYIVMMKSVAFITGKRSRNEFLTMLDYYKSVQFVNSKLPAGSRVMLLGLQMGYHIRHEYLVDESWDSTEWRRLLTRNASMTEINNDLKRQGITHILFSPMLARLAARTGRQGSGGVQYMTESNSTKLAAVSATTPDYLTLRNWATFDAYKDQFLEPIYSDETGHIVFRIR